MPKTITFGAYFSSFTEKQQRDFREIYQQNTHPVPQLRRFITEAYKKFKDDTLIIRCNLLRHENYIYSYDYLLKEWEKQVIEEPKKPPIEKKPPVVSKTIKKQKNSFSKSIALANAKGLKITLILEPDSITEVESLGKKQTRFKIKYKEMVFEAALNSKSYRKALAAINELGADNCSVVLQAIMQAQGKLECAGFQIQSKKNPE